MLHLWIKELPERQREALMLSRYHDLSHREIALIMRISPRTVNNHIIRALNHLNERIQTFEPAILK
jgi:RNA polymerase sigma-70 factor (ECF subfamily)